MSAEPFDHETVMWEVAGLLDDLGGPSAEAEHLLLYALLIDCLGRLARLAHGRTVGMTATAMDVCDRVRAVLDEAEGIHGPVGDDYQTLMRTLLADIARRAVSAKKEGST